MKKNLFFLIRLILGLGLISVFMYFYVSKGDFLTPQKDIAFGVTFSSFMARQLDLDSREVFDAVVNDLGAKKIRLPVYWQDIESEEGKFNFEEYDYFVAEAEKNGIELVLNTGRKLPRWPECHIPEWSKGLSNKDFENAILRQMQETVHRYKDSSAVVAWQIENEHFHVFGAGCASDKIDAYDVDREIELVRSLSPKPIMLTDAGKAGAWFTSLWKDRGDVLGVTMYYQVWKPDYGVWQSTFGPGLFWLKRQIIQLFFPHKKIIVAELQGEPYGPEILPRYDLSLQKELMNPEIFRETIKKARKAGFEENYLWGVEWWYWLKERQNDALLWGEARGLFKK